MSQNILLGATRVIRGGVDGGSTEQVGMFGEMGCKGLYILRDDGSRGLKGFPGEEG